MKFKSRLVSYLARIQTVCLECIPVSLAFAFTIQCDPTWQEKFESRRNSGLITTSDLIWFALQIARGLQFLTKRKVLHRDVALRNILLKSDFTLKIADFGLSRRLYDGDDAYTIWKNRYGIPIRNTALESLVFGRCTIQSECWSFGVVIWELFTFAAHQPYTQEIKDGGSNDSFLWSRIEAYLLSGGRLSIPDTVPKRLKNLILELWHEDPEQRPTFKTCRKLLRNELMEACPHILSSEKSASLNTSEVSVFQVDVEENKETTRRALKSILMNQGVTVGILLLTILGVGALLSTTLVIPILPKHDRANKTETIKPNWNQHGSNQTGTGPVPYTIISGGSRLIFISGISFNNSVLFQPFLNQESAFILTDSGEVINLNLNTGLAITIGNLRPTMNVFIANNYRNDVMIDADVAIRAPNIYLITLHECDFTKICVITYAVTQEKLSFVRFLDFSDGWNFEVRKILKDEMGKLYIIFFDWNTNESGDDETLFIITEIFVGYNGNITSYAQRQKGKTKMNGRWTAPFIRLGNLYWPLQLNTLENNTSSNSSIEISLITMDVSFKEPIVNFDLCPKPRHINFWLSSVQIDEAVCYFIFSEPPEKSSLCYIDIEQMAWRPIKLKDFNETEGRVTIGNWENGTLGFLGTTGAGTPLVAVDNFKELKKERNPFIIPLGNSKKTIPHSEFHNQDLKDALYCVHPDGGSLFAVIANSLERAVFKVNLQHSQQRLTESTASLETTIQDNVERAYIVTRSSRTYIILFSLSKIGFASHMIGSNSTTFINEIYADDFGIKITLTGGERYFRKDEKDNLYFICYWGTIGESQTYVVVLSINVADNGTIKADTVFNSHFHDEHNGSPWWKLFIFSGELFWISNNPKPFDDNLFKLSLTGKDKGKVLKYKFNNSLKYVDLNDFASWDGPIIIGHLVFFYSPPRNSGPNFGQLLFIDMQTTFWYAIKLELEWAFEYRKLMRSDKYQLFLFGNCVQKECKDEYLLYIIDVKKLVHKHSNGSFNVF